MDRRWFLTMLAGVGVGAEPISAVDGNARTSMVDSDARPPESTMNETDKDIDDESAGRLRGTRAGISDPISLADGVTTLDVTYPADSTISLKLVADDEITDGRQLLVDETGREAGTVFLATDGEYRIAVTTSGPWEIMWTQPTAGASETNDITGDESAFPPQRASGAGPSHIGPVLMARTTELLVEHTGEGPIVVTAYTTNGNRQRLVDTHGEANEWTTTDLTGAAWFDIAASGEWTLEVF